MNLAWQWTVKEWRAQRAFLAGFVALIAIALTATLTIAHWHWREKFDAERLGVVVLAFMAATGCGSLLAAAAAVRDEFTGRDDQFWRRLPSGLQSGLRGKLLFLALLLPGLLLLGYAFGQTWTLVVEHRFLDGPALVAAADALTPLAPPLLVLVPWVFAIAFWLPRARLAIVATAVLGLGLAMVVCGILGQCRGLADTLAREPWQGLWPWLFALGVVVAWISGTRGRRGGGVARSATLGAATTVLGLLPPATWFGSWVHAYWHPDGTQLGNISPLGATADGRFAVVHGSAMPNWPALLVRIDLRDGSTRVLSAPDERETTWGEGQDLQTLVRSGLPGITDHRRTWILDVATGERHELGVGTDLHALELPAAIAARWSAFVRADSPLRRPGNVPVWFEGNRLCTLGGNGRDVQVPLRQDCMVRPTGHGVFVNDRDPARRHFDLTRLGFVALPADAEPFSARCVNGWWLFATPERARVWRCVHPTQGVDRALPTLTGAEPLGLLDDDTMLFALDRAGVSTRLWAYAPATDTLTQLDLPRAGFAADRAITVTGGHDPGTYGERDHRGHRVLYLHRQGRTGNRIVAIDPRTRTCEVLLDTELLTEVLWHGPDGERIACEDYRRLVRYDREARRTVIHPR